jgi:acyl carrier protein
VTEGGILEINRFIENIRTIFDNGEELILSPSTDIHTLEEWDSLAVLGFITMVDSEYDIKIAAADIKSARTIEDLHSLVVARTARP